ncbi:hypothetical protein [Sphingomicrobium marinum]|uniref:hypothetical protein n=1 Tax=Sphingomicrobium marinum TaxID=1227950 RepID=UPI00224021FC|nr:hypothetical protein [Sphingomicrobium marinum]
MRICVLTSALLLAACADDEPRTPEEPALDTGNIVGLYENDRGDRLCIAPTEDGAHKFAFVTLGAEPAACSGLGSVSRAGDRLRLELEGEERCSLDARLEDGQLSIPPTLADECAYYCSAGTSFAGRELIKTADGLLPLGEAEDLVGDPLCL